MPYPRFVSRISDLDRTEMKALVKDTRAGKSSDMLSQLQNTLRKRKDRKSLEAKYLAMAKSGK